MAVKKDFFIYVARLKWYGVSCQYSSLIQNEENGSEFICYISDATASLNGNDNDWHATNNQEFIGRGTQRTSISLPVPSSPNWPQPDQTTTGVQNWI